MRAYTPKYSGDLDHTTGSCGISPRRELADARSTLVYQVTPRSRPLWEFESVAEFESCYAGIVETHFRASGYGVLHRDISDNTALWRRSPDGKAVGSLLDWDISCAMYYHLDGEATDRPSRRGTSPFIALDLQYVASNGKLLPQTHRYHHDLESFFWLLLWAIAHYDFECKHRLPCRFSGWIDDWVKRNSFMYSMHTRREYLQLTLKPWEDVRKRWVWPLFRMFSGAREASNDIDEEGLDFLNEERYGELVTFEAFMEMIKSEPS
ncbi:hypothetical protein K525DRAFT_266900 [Schizophyllum commune Loenen D]|nr:hypothetical protein K525DRAFT_266900 [Schizophyllum commune Loenen D]